MEREVPVGAAPNDGRPGYATGEVRTVSDAWVRPAPGDYVKYGEFGPGRDKTGIYAGAVNGAAVVVSDAHDEIVFCVEQALTVLYRSFYSPVFYNGQRKPIPAAMRTAG